MNPFILAFKFFILMSTGQTIDQQGDQDFNNFVIHKVQTYQSQIQDFSTPLHLQSNMQNSILHQRQMTHQQKLAIFCKMEHELAKASGFAVKFRIGDQSFVDQLEGK